MADSAATATAAVTAGDADLPPNKRARGPETAEGAAQGAAPGSGQAQQEKAARKPQSAMLAAAAAAAAGGEDGWVSEGHEYIGQSVRGVSPRPRPRPRPHSLSASA